jgi:hypothetical protein
VTHTFDIGSTLLATAEYLAVFYSQLTKRRQHVLVKTVPQYLSNPSRLTFSDSGTFEPSLCVNDLIDFIDPRKRLQ